MMKWPCIVLVLLLFSTTACRQTGAALAEKPQRTLKEYFDKKYLLYKLPENYYANEKLNGSFTDFSEGALSDFKPVGYNTSLNLQYTHVYSDKCVYHTSDSMWKYAEVCFPNTCLTNTPVYASVKVRNTSAERKVFHARLFYQNTTYWYATDDSISNTKEDYLDNYYGASAVVDVSIAPNSDTVIQLPYSIGMNPKGQYDFDPSKDPARPGNYEFMVLASTNSSDVLFSKDLNLQKTNPFAVIKKDQLQNGGKQYLGNAAYTGAHHFKFVFLDEYFDGANDLTPNHIYVAKDGNSKKLCDTCTGWYGSVINEFWKSSDFLGGYISKAHLVKADYGIKKENCRIDDNGVTITIPKSRRGEYKKTWGEFLFGPSFKYGHLTVSARFAQMMNKTGTPNGIVHNLWLYQRDPQPVDTTHPYAHLVNDFGLQPYEIDFEIWNSQEGINTMWDDNAFINYSIVDYMRDSSVRVRPDEMKRIGKYKANRYNERQINIAGENLPRQYFDSTHIYELYWYPDKVRFVVDGKEKGLITKDMAKIPDDYLFLWIGSPMYQDGTYYSQSFIPFLKRDKRTVINYIKIE